jgi:hypothetical protein
MPPNSIPDVDQLVIALFLVSLLLYLTPAVFSLYSFAEGRLGTVIAIAVVASVIWFTR